MLKIEKEYLLTLAEMASCKNCDTPTDFKMCPSRMADGRAFTDYRPRCIVNSELMTKVSNSGKMQSSYESRMYLQQNAEQVMQQERIRAVERLVPCAPCKRPLNDAGTMLPERYVVRCDGVTCSRTETNPMGLGDGRSY